jgi:hypothetical protein
MTKGEGVRKISRAGRILERLPASGDGEPLPPPPIGNEATSREIQRATEAMMTHQEAHLASERETVPLARPLSAKDSALIKEILTDPDLIKDEGLRRMAQGERMAALAGLLRAFDAAPDEND